MFLGTFEPNLMDKGRIALPKKIREELGRQKLVLTIGFEECIFGFTQKKWDEVTKFVIEPAFYQVDVIALVHIHSWNKVPKDLQDVLSASMQEVEREAYEHFRKLISEDREKIKKKGLQEVKFSGEEGERYLQTAYEASWKEVLKKDPQLGAQLRDLLSK